MPPAHPGWCIHISRRRHVCNAFDLELIVVVQAAKNKRFKCRFPLCFVLPHAETWGWTPQRYKLFVKYQGRRGEKHYFYY